MEINLTLLCFGEIYWNQTQKMGGFESFRAKPPSKHKVITTAVEIRVLPNDAKGTLPVKLIVPCIYWHARLELL